MSFLSSISNIVKNVVPKVTSFISTIESNPVGKLGIDILKQLASSAFSKDGSGGVFSDNLQVTLPNPLSRLNGLLGNIGKTFSGVSDFLKNIGSFLQGNRTLETGKDVNVPRLGDRASTSATHAATIAKDIASGHYASTIAAGAPTHSTASSGSILSNVDPKAFSTDLTGDQRDMLSKVKDETQRAQMEAQFKMMNYQNLMSFISNMMKIMGDVSKTIVSNIR